MAKPEPKTKPLVRTIGETLAVTLQVINELAAENDESPRTIARALIRHFGDSAADAYLMSDRDPESGGWVGLSPDCEEYRTLQRCLAIKLHDENLPRIIQSFDYSKHQSKIAKNPRKRVKVAGEGFSVSGKIKELAKRKDQVGDWIPPKELWPDLYSWLEEKQLNPEELDDAYSYDKDDDYNRVAIKFSSFRTIIYKARKTLI